MMLSCNENKADNIVIEVSTSGCYKSCPILDLRFNHNEIYFNFIKNNYKKGTYKYKLTNQELSKIDSLLSIINIHSLKESYTSHRSDMQIYSTRIVIGNKEKEVLFYDNEAPKNFENLVDFLINIRKNKELEKTNIMLNLKTREKVKILKLPVPPIPKS